MSRSMKSWSICFSFDTVAVFSSHHNVHNWENEKLESNEQERWQKGAKFNNCLIICYHPKPASCKIHDNWACYPEHAPPTHQMDTDQCHQLISWSPPQALAHLTCPPLVKPSLAFLTSSQWTITFFLVLFFFSDFLSSCEFSSFLLLSHSSAQKWWLIDWKCCSLGQY